MGCGCSKGYNTNIKLYNLLLSHVNTHREPELQEKAKRLALQHNTLINMPWTSSEGPFAEDISETYVQESHYPPVNIDISNLHIDNQIDILTHTKLVPSVPIRPFITLLYKTIEGYRSCFAIAYCPTKIKKIIFYTQDSSISVTPDGSVDIQILNDMVALAIIY